MGLGDSLIGNNYLYLHVSISRYMINLIYPVDVGLVDLSTSTIYIAYIVYT